MTRTPAQRAAAHRAARVNEGWRQVNLLLSPAAAKALDSLTADGATKREAIERALIEAVTRSTDRPRTRA